MPYTREQSDRIRRLAEAATGRKLNANGDPITGIELHDPVQDEVVGRLVPNKPIELGSVDWVEGVEVDESREPAAHPYQGFPTTNLTETAAGPGTSDVEPEVSEPGDLTSEATMDEVMAGMPQEETKDSEFNQSELVQAAAEGKTNVGPSDDATETDGRNKRSTK